MKSEWYVSTIDDVCLLVTDGAHNSPPSVENGEYMASVKDFAEYGFDFSTCKRISSEDYSKLEKQGCVPNIGDVLVGKDGARYFEDIVIYKQPERPALLSSIAILRVNPEIITSEFLYYTLKSPAVKKDVRDNYGSGSAIPRIVLKDFKRMPIRYPSIEDQRKITLIFEAIDAKIDLNNRINDNLADIIQSVYQNRFSSTRSDVTAGVLADICSYSKDKVPVLDLNNSNYYSTENMQSDKKGAVDAATLPTIAQTTKCRKGDVLISNIRPYFKKIVYCQFDCGCSTDVLCFCPKESALSAFLFSTLYADHFFDFMAAGAKGTKMPRGDKQQIMTYPIYLPSADELAEFNSIAIPALTQMECSRLENTRLTALRDALLPKLMSGELDVSAIEL